MNPYKTLLKDASEEYIIQKSRFIGRAAPVQTAEEALQWIDAIRQEHRAATHNCFAYIIGQNAGIMRYSDDGEPGGTAGLPMMEVLKARSVVDCAVVVTRYFGGVLLGAGGLVRAYSHSCAIALDAAQVCQMHPSQHWMMEVEYPLWDKVQHVMKSLPVRLVNTEFSATVNFEVLCKSDDELMVIGELVRCTDGRLERMQTAESYIAWEEPQP